MTKNVHVRDTHHGRWGRKRSNGLKAKEGKRRYQTRGRVNRGGELTAVSERVKKRKGKGKGKLHLSVTVKAAQKKVRAKGKRRERKVLLGRRARVIVGHVGGPEK